MPTWVEVFAVFAVSHVVGDYLLQTDFQAVHKRGGLGRNPIARRALLAHVTTYTVAFAPALVWLAGELSALALAGVAALIFVPHLVQDDGRLLSAYIVKVKRTRAAEPLPLVALAVDQSFHLVVLFCLSLLVVA